MEASNLAHLQVGPLPYLVRQPKRRGSGTHPVLFFLHGYDEGPPTEIQVALTRHGPLRPGNDSAILDNFVVVAPQMPVRGDFWHRHTKAVSEIVNHVHRCDQGDPRRTYLTGFSFGANGVFDLALAQPEIWSALWSVDPTRPPANILSRPIWLSIGERARHRKDAFLDTLSLLPANQQNNGDAIFDDEGADHVGTALLAYRNDQIYNWLLSKSLP
jgi:predicted peptidase